MTREEEAEALYRALNKATGPFDKLQPWAKDEWLKLRDAAQSLYQPTWQPIATAPRGDYVDIDTPKGSKTVFKKAVIWTYRVATGHMTTSHWIEEESRWNNYAKGESPDLWHHYYPMAPVVETADDLI